MSRYFYGYCSKIVFGIGFLFVVGVLHPVSAGAGHTPKNIAHTLELTPIQALERLKEGNQRFMQDKPRGADRHQLRRMATVAKQKPFAIVVGCSDSRVPPEIAFDQGIGDIFVVRIAGNVVSTLEMNSVEYSALYNHSSIVIVLGHQNCGAVSAVLNHQTQDIEAIADLIKPALLKLEENPNMLESAIIANVNNSVARIKRSKVISKLIEAGKINVVGAYYELESGKIRFLSNS